MLLRTGFEKLTNRTVHKFQVNNLFLENTNNYQITKLWSQ